MKLRYFILIAAILSVSHTVTKAQTRLQGQVLDVRGNSISYSQIGINGTNIYKLSDVQGNFDITLPKSQHQKQLTFLAPGYKTVSYPIDSLLTLDKVIIELKGDVQRVSGTRIKSAKLKTRVKGNKVPPIGAMQLSLSQTNTSYGISQKVPGKYALLRSISFSVSNDTVLNLTVRPFVYAITDNEIDYSRNLILTNKIFNYEVKKGWLTMDLSDMDVEVSDLIVFGVEWIAIDGPPNPVTSMSLTLMSGRNSFERVGLQKLTPYKGFGSFSIKGTFEFY